MSSEGSVTSTASRIRQFGLYRTIDARTDEFLRSSRRRQIRQGCACAAISTAITVTVVVSVILVYEYSINSESNVDKKLTVKPNWLILMNESDPTQSDSKFERKINFDRTTLKLLPILIKAFNKNRYLEKIIEDYSSSSPPTEGVNETESYFQRNIFSNSKNWLKMPSSKGYTIDYKSSPVLHTRRPTMYSDYLSRVRKIKNYKKVLNNFDTAIGEKIIHSKPSETLKTHFSSTKKPLKAVKHYVKINKTKPVVKKKSTHLKDNNRMVENLTNKVKNITKPILPIAPCSKIGNKKLNVNKGYCKCPKDMGLLISKLIQIIKEMIPNMSSKNQNQSSCNNKEKYEAHENITKIKSVEQEHIIQHDVAKSTTLKKIAKSTKLATLKKEVYDVITESENINIITTPQTQLGLIDLPEVKSVHETTTQLHSISLNNTSTTEIITQASSIVNQSTTVITPIDIGAVKSPENILKQIPMYENYDVKDLNDEINTLNNLQDKSIFPYIDKNQSTTTELIMPLKGNSHSNEASLSSESFLDSVAVMPNYKHPITSLIKDNEYEDYYLTTRRSTNDFDDLDVHTFELVKTKNFISTPTKNERNRFRNNMKKVSLTSKNYHPVVKSKDTGYINMRKMADLINLPKIILNEGNTPSLSPVYENESTGNTSFTTKKDKETGLLKNIIRIQKSEILSNTSHKTLSNIETTPLTGVEGDQNIENINEDEFQDDWTKNAEITENNIKYNKSSYDDEPLTSQNNYESKFYDKINSLKSMLPAIRPVYLEIRRSSDWKPEEHLDYDVILLIYEYAIAVEWSLVENRKDINTLNQPMADRLDRTYFGFDQDYFEQMPLLINALQEKSYIESSLEMTDFVNKRTHSNATVLNTTVKPTFKTSGVRRTSPKPFYFKYRHPTPLPFSKTYGSRSWVERYRNEERLKNIRQIIKYLENTIHAKVGEMHAKPTEKHIGFTGFYIEPMLEDKRLETYKPDLQAASSDNIKKLHLNHLADPLFNFKPENPGDVNLLADDFLRFSPIITPSEISKSYEYPMFRQIPFKNRNCHGNKCEENKENNNQSFQSSTTINQMSEKPPLSTTKSFSVMLNLYPIQTKIENIKQDIATTTQALHKIYLTTARPLVQFKRKSNLPFRRIYTPYKRPRYLSNLINKDSKSNKTKENMLPEITKPVTQMTVHVKVFSEQPLVENKTGESYSTTTNAYMHTNPYTTKAPIEFSTSQIEDYHVGSSGYIPVPEKTDKSSLKVTTKSDFFYTTTEYLDTERALTSSVVKFNIQDAKVPRHYIDLNKKVSKEDISRRNSMEFIDHTELIKENNKEHMNLSKPIDTDVENNTLIVKLKKNMSKNMTHTTDANIEEITTPVWTNVAQINGHYRSINQNSENVNKWMNTDPKNHRETRLEKRISGSRTFVPKYVEIVRNNSKSENTEDTKTPS